MRGVVPVTLSDCPSPHSTDHVNAPPWSAAAASVAVSVTDRAVSVGCTGAFSLTPASGATFVTLTATVVGVGQLAV